ncbi:MAG: Fructose-bisphosphate aldolase [Glaciihabitans sp.]|nr:Fructose-bisphosphate aldolase [Glaciihabitans sp.]
MPVIPSRDLLDSAVASGRAVAAFNVITLEHAEGIVQGAEQAGLPVILQLSENAVRYHGSATAIAHAMGDVAAAAKVDVALHLDHITDIALMRLAPELLFSSVMFDASEQPYNNNIELTQSAVEWGAQHGVWIEAELGEVGGKDGAHAPGVRTDPTEAHRFVERTGVDALAVAVGSSHAMTTRDASLDHDLIGRLRSAVAVPLVLHGSSGVPDDELSRAAAGGMLKINIGTALNIAYSSAIRAFLDGDRAAVDPRAYLRVGRDAIADTVAHYLRVVAGR